MKQDEDSAESSSTEELTNEQDDPVLNAIEGFRFQLINALKDVERRLTQKIEDVKKQMVVLMHPSLPSGRCMSHPEKKTWERYPCRQFFANKRSDKMENLRFGCLMHSKFCWRQKSFGSDEYCTGKVGGFPLKCNDMFQRYANSSCNRIDLLCE